MVRTKKGHLNSALVTGGSINQMGVVRALGRQGIPINLVSIDRMDMVRYSRYATKRLVFPFIQAPEEQFVDFLVTLGKKLDDKCVIIPTNDIETMVFSKYKKELEPYFILPIPSFEVVEKLVNKKLFYQWLEQMSFPHPKTYYPKDSSEIRSIGREMEYPFVIKPACTHLFRPKFHAKGFFINSPQELENAARMLENETLEVVMQENIPGRELYSLLTYFNKESKPLATCGYDKPRQYPPDFGNGSLCRSAWRSGPIDLSIQILKALNYTGIAEPEFKRDTRDGEYKLLEINARTSMQSCLPRECGVDITYIAYLDAIGQYKSNSASPRDGVLWIHEVFDLLSCLRQIKGKQLTVKEVLKSFKGKKVFTIAAWDDPVPFFVFIFNLFIAGLKRIFLRRK